MFDIDGVMDTYREPPALRFAALPPTAQEQALVYAATLLRQCGICGVTFVRNRKQRYCTPQHMQKAQDRKKTIKRRLRKGTA